MNKTEARQIIEAQLRPFRDKPYSELVEMIGKEPVTFEITGPSGVEYQIELQTFWDGRPNGNIRVFGFIDDGGWRSFFPLGSSFIKSPDNTFVGE